MSNAYGGGSNSPVSQAQLQAMIRKQIQNANNRDLSFTEDVLNRAGGGGPFWQGRPEMTLNQLGTDWRNIRSLDASRRYWDRGLKFGSGMKERHRARGREIADGYADEEDQDGPYSWEGESDEQPEAMDVEPRRPEPEMRSTYVSPEPEGGMVAAPETPGKTPPSWARTWAASKAILNDPAKMQEQRGKFLTRQEQRQQGRQVMYPQIIEGEEEDSEF